MITNPQRNRLAKFLDGGVEDANLAPAVFYVGLSTVAIPESGVISGEVTGGGYERIAIPNNTSNFSTPDASNPGKVFNMNTFEWPESTESWGTIKTVFFTYSKTANEALYCVSVNREVPAYSIIYFKGDTTSGDLNFSINN